MANQLKKKFIGNDQVDGEKILLGVGQTLRKDNGSGGTIDVIGEIETSISNEVAARIAGDADTLSQAQAYTGTQVSALEDYVDQELAILSQADADNLVEAKAYTDTQVALVQSAVDTVESDLAAEVSRATAAEAALQSDINTEKGRIDAILSASQADKDSFAEIVTLINSIDTENDQAFAGYVLSNNAAVAAVEGRVTTAEGEIDALQSDVADHETRITALEGALAPTWAPAFKKDLDATDVSNGYIDLPHLVVPNSVIAFVDRLAIHETEEFTVSTVGGVTRLTFTGPLVSPGQQSLDANDNIYVKYQILA